MKTTVLFIIGLMLITTACKKNNNSNDNTPPVITMNGGSPVYTEKGTFYNDLGATAYDETDGDITSDIVINNVVDVNVEGTYYVSYNVKDKAGNKATEVIRTVIVKVF